MGVDDFADDAREFSDEQGGAEGMRDDADRMRDVAGDEDDDDDEDDEYDRSLTTPRARQTSARTRCLYRRIR